MSDHSFWDGYFCAQSAKASGATVDLVDNAFDILGVLNAKAGDKGESIIKGQEAASKIVGDVMAMTEKAVQKDNIVVLLLSPMIICFAIMSTIFVKWIYLILGFAKTILNIALKLSIAKRDTKTYCSEGMETR